jgi:lipopolysaccharide export system ATP-binding protein
MMSEQSMQDQSSTQAQPRKVLRIENLAKTYDKRKVVRDVSFQLTSGQIVGLLGPNGAGKTTSFYMLVGLVQMDHGRIFLDNKDLSPLAMHERARRGIGYLPQEPSIFRKLSIADNIMAILETRSDLTKAQKNEKLEALLEEFHITHIRNSLGMSVSGGERRRAEIARALALDPIFILLDEPFAGVDPISVAEIKKIIESLKCRGIGVLITDHNVRETLAICEKAYIVSEGAVIAEGTPAEILANELVRQVYLGDDFKLT